MDLTDHLIELSDKFFPEPDYLFSVLYQLHIPHIQCFLILRMEEQLLEQFVALQQDPVVGHQGMNIQLI